MAMGTWTAFVEEHVRDLQRPATLLYWPYVVSAAVLTLLFLRKSLGMTFREGLRVVGSPRTWLARSTRTDVVMTLVHEMFVAGPTFALSTCVSNNLFGAVRGQLAPAVAAGVGWAPPILIQSILMTAAVTLAVDLGTFVAHRLHHAVPVLWEMHAVHHSADRLTFFTAHRVHPLEALLRGAIQGVLTALVMVAFSCVFGRVAPMLTVWGMGVGFLAFSFTNNLLHSPVPVRYPRWLRRFVLSPHIHHLHHSRLSAHQDRNFGAIFPYWDRLCGTYLDREVGLGELTFGLDPAKDLFRHSLLRCYLMPLFVPVERATRVLCSAVGRWRRASLPLVRQVPPQKAE
ncbi:MAG TPA: sterol desaturase family protein [Polyangiaceae bacterium]|nr:sterol desaturase family protein [Polyangiaceae bacterium]